jgi:hypothetical protein
MEGGLGLFRGPTASRKLGFLRDFGDQGRFDPLFNFAAEKRKGSADDAVIQWRWKNPHPSPFSDTSAEACATFVLFRLTAARLIVVIG